MIISFQLAAGGWCWTEIVFISNNPPPTHLMEYTYFTGKNGKIEKVGKSDLFTKILEGSEVSS